MSQAPEAGSPNPEVSQNGHYDLSSGSAFDPLAQAREDANPEHVKQRKAYEEWVVDPSTGRVDPSSAADFVLYAVNRPNEVQATSGKDYFDNQRQIHYNTTQTPYRDMEHEDASNEIKDAVASADLTRLQNILSARPEILAETVELDISQLQAKQEYYESKGVKPAVNIISNFIAQRATLLPEDAGQAGEVEEEASQPVVSEADEKAEAKTPEAVKQLEEVANEPQDHEAESPETDDEFYELIDKYAISNGEIVVFDKDFKESYKIQVLDAQPSEEDDMFEVLRPSAERFGEFEKETISGWQLLHDSEESDKRLAPTSRSSKHFSAPPVEKYYIKAAETRNSLRLERTQRQIEKWTPHVIRERDLGIAQHNAKLINRIKRRFYSLVDRFYYRY